MCLMSWFQFPVQRSRSTNLNDNQKLFVFNIWLNKNQYFGLKLKKKKKLIKSIKPIQKNYKLEAGAGKTNWQTLNYCPLNLLNHSFHYQILREQFLLTLRIFIDTLGGKKAPIFSSLTGHILPHLPTLFPLQILSL